MLLYFVLVVLFFLVFARENSIVKKIYSKEYANSYKETYVNNPIWNAKNDYSISIIRKLLRGTGVKTWLDVCCGQAWQMTKFSNVEKYGIDMSNNQLKIANKNNPNSKFIQGDVLTFNFPNNDKFDLVTMMSGSYGYLKSKAEIIMSVMKMIHWTKPGGSLYIEILPRSGYLKNGMEKGPFLNSQGGLNPFRDLKIKIIDSEQWTYTDSGGTHIMYSPSVDFFESILEKSFKSVTLGRPTNGFDHIIAMGKH